MYMKNLNFCLWMYRFSGVHPEKIGERSQDFLFFIVFSANIVMLCLAVLLFIYSDDMILTEIAGCLESILLICHGTLKLANLYVHRSNIRDLLWRLSDFWKIEHLDDEGQKAACRRTMRTLKILTILYVVSSFSAVFCIAIIPIMTYNLVFASHIPKGVPYNAFYFFQSFVYVTGIFVPCVGTDFLYMNVVFVITLQFQLLNFNVDKIFRVDDTEGDKGLRKRIKHWVDYHNYLLEFVKLLNETFSLTLFLYFGNTVLSTCMELFIISIQPASGDNMKYYTYICILFFEFIAYYCLPGQMVTNETDQLSYNIYASKWREYTSTSVKTAMNMLLVRSQRKVFISAGILDASFQTCLGTLKTIASYYMFLKTMSDDTQ